MKNNKKVILGILAILVVGVGVYIGSTEYQKGALMRGISRRPLNTRGSFYQPGFRFAPPPGLPPPQLPDLQVSFDSPTSVRVDNKGGPTQQNFITQVMFFTKDKANSTQELPTNGLTAGGWSSVGIDQNMAKSAYQIMAMVDSGQAVAESDETNNRAYFKVLPDLAVTDIINQLVTPAQVGFNIRNINTWFNPGKAAGPFKVKVETYSVYNTKIPVSTNYVSVSGLGIGEDTKYLYVFPSGIYPGIDIFKVVVTVDSDNAVLELSEDNVFFRTFNLTSDFCKEYRAWQQQGVLTPNLGGQSVGGDDIAVLCDQKFPPVTESRCKQLKFWQQQGVLSKNLPNSPEPAACARLYPNIWNGVIDFSARCRQLHSWFEQGTLTPNLKGDLTEVGICEQMTSPFSVTRQQCANLKQLFDQGVLSDGQHQADFENAQACSGYYLDIWYGWPSEARCVQLRQWGDQGVLTKNLNGDLTEAKQCSVWYPYVWY